MGLGWMRLDEARWDALTQGQRRFLEALDRKLAWLDPPLLAGCDAKLNRHPDRPVDLLEVDILHRDDPRFNIGVTVEDAASWREAIVYVGDGFAHEHFDHECCSDLGEDGWITAATGFIEELLTGRIEYEVRYAGHQAVAVRGRRVQEAEPDDPRVPSYLTLYPTLRVLNPFVRRRTVLVRPNYFEGDSKDRSG